MPKDSTILEISCPYCQFLLQKQARFCSNCGKSLSVKTVPKLSIRQFLLIVAISVFCATMIYQLQPWFQGRRPKQEFSQQRTSNPEIEAVGNADELFSQAEAAMRKIAESEHPDSALMLEAVDLLSRILSAEPENAWALLQMAELSFEQRIFDKSAEFYGRYLKVTPDDLAVRTRYASALTFSGKASQALSELEIVLASEPNNFQALAFAAIASQEAGQKEKAQSMLAKALILAPSDEARERLQKFAKSLEEKAGTQSASTEPKTTQEINQGLSPKRGNIEGPFSSLDTYFRNHPIAGPKYAGLEVKGSEIRVKFNNFPMDKMPPFVKEKFAANARTEALKDMNGGKYTIVFVDTGTGGEMARVEVGE